MRDYEDDEYYEEEGYRDRGYRGDDGYGRRYGDNAGFDDEEFSGAYQPRDQRRREWSDDFDERDGGRPRRVEQRTRRTEPRREYRGRDDYDADDRYEAPRRRRPAVDSDDDGYGESRNVKPDISFRKRHPVLMNFIYICFASVVAGWLP